MKPTLVILAAGMGSRYGGMKQLEAVGPSGETIMDYSIYDALRAGFGKAIFIIRRDMQAAFKETIGRRYEDRMPVACAFQELDQLPAGYSAPSGRTKPWGTAHAVLAAEKEVREPFAVVNADDFYGANSFAALSEFLQRPTDGDVPTYAMVAYELRDTLSEAGPVNRGCCNCTPDGWLERITEIVGIERHGPHGRYKDESSQERVVRGDELVSMNTWGFTPDFFDRLRGRFEKFLGDNATSMTAEFYLPNGVQELMHADRARVKVLPTTDKWIGVTHPEDKAHVVAMIHRLVDEGRYPQRLWD